MPAETQIWRVTPAGRVIAVVVVLGFVVVAAGVTVGGTSPGIAVILWCATVAIGIGAWRWAFVPYVALTPDGVVVQNMFDRVEVPYPDIALVGVSYAGLTIRRGSGGRLVVAWAVQKSNFARWMRRRTRADDVADAIRARARSSAR